MELRAFERMEEDIRLIGYFKGEDSCQSTCKLNDALAVSWTSPDGGEMDWKYISVRPSYHFIVPGWQHDQRLMTTECILTCCFAGSRQWRLLTLKRAFWNQLLDISFNTVDVCLFFSFVLDFFPLYSQTSKLSKRLQSVSNHISNSLLHLKNLWVKQNNDQPNNSKLLRPSNTADAKSTFSTLRNVILFLV